MFDSLKEVFRRTRLVRNNALVRHDDDDDDFRCPNNQPSSSSIISRTRLRSPSVPMGTQPEQPKTCDILFLGLERTGKTYLIKQLLPYCGGKEDANTLSKRHHECIPSHGANIDVLRLTKQKKKIVVKEVGGSMLITWKRFLDDCKSIVVCVRRSAGKIAPAFRYLNICFFFTVCSRSFE